jgi:hypothetical protein
MKKMIVLTMVIVFLTVTGCVSNKGWVRKDSQPVNEVQLEKDFRDCNHGWVLALILDPVGIYPLIHSFKAKKCMDKKGYTQEK